MQLASIFSIAFFLFGLGRYHTYLRIGSKYLYSFIGSRGGGGEQKKIFKFFLSNCFTNIVKVFVMLEFFKKSR